MAKSVTQPQRKCSHFDKKVPHIFEYVWHWFRNFLQDIFFWKEKVLSRVYQQVEWLYFCFNFWKKNKDSSPWKQKVWKKLLKPSEYILYLKFFHPPAIVGNIIRHSLLNFHSSFFKNYVGMSDWSDLVRVVCFACHIKIWETTFKNC